MAGTRFQVRSYGADKIARHLIGLGRRAEDLRPAWPGVARRAARGYERSFDHSGPGWPALKRSTELRRMRDGLAPGPPMVATGKYRKAAINPDRLMLVEGPTELGIFVDDDVAAFHRDGTNRVPARPLKLSFGDRMLIVREIDLTLMEGYWNG